MNEVIYVFQTIANILAVLLIGGVAGFYVGNRGIAGVQSDLNDIKTDVTTLKAKINAA